MASLLEQVSGPLFLPNITAFIPVQNIDVIAYEMIRANCPFLGLPSATQGLNDLQNQLDKVYEKLTDQLSNHSWGRLGNLQLSMNNYLNKIHISSSFENWLQCFVGVCGVKSLMDDQLALYHKNFVVGQGAVLTESQQAKYGQITAGITQLNTLRGI